MEPSDEYSHAAEVRQNLERILSSTDFAAPDRLRRFLRYVVEETLAGRQSRLKAYTIGVAVFDRSEDFDAMNDPVVRIEAGRLRRALERYYLLEGKSNSVVIELRKGSYVPTFHHPAIAPHAVQCEVPPQLSPAANGLSYVAAKLPPWTRRLHFLAGGLAVALLTVAANLGTVVLAPRESARSRATPSNQAEVFVSRFVSLTPEPTATAFAAGLSEEIIDRLHQLNRFQVFQKGTMVDSPRPTRSDGSLQSMSVELEGSVRQSGDKVRVTARLLDGRTAAVRWAGVIEEDPRRIPNMEAVIAAELADLIGLQMTAPRISAATRGMAH